MMRRALLAAALAVPLGACVSLFPKAEPEQLYRFGAAPPEAPPHKAARFGVLKGPTAFSRAAAGDRILTVTGGEAAFVGGSRWVTPASILFDEALFRAFDGARARLIGRGEVAQADYTLKLDVRTFEARYDGRGAPQVVVEVRAAMTRTSDRMLTGERVFTANVRASENRMGAITQAFDMAVSQVLGELVAWTSNAGT